MSDEAPNPVTPPGATIDNSKKTANVELIKSVLEFIGKCFYPGIIVAIIALSMPTLNKINVEKLLDRLKILKYGDWQVELAASERADKAADSARLAKLESIVYALQSQASSSLVNIPRSNQQNGNAVGIQPQPIQKYKVLVFHQRENDSTSKKIVNALLMAGYISSDTQTDFSELQKIQPIRGEVYITYNSDGANALLDVKKRIEDLKAELKLALDVKINPRAIDLHRGDIQVLVF